MFVSVVVDVLLCCCLGVDIHLISCVVCFVFAIVGLSVVVCFCCFLGGRVICLVLLLLMIWIVFCVCSCSVSVVVNTTRNQTRTN